MVKPTWFDSSNQIWEISAQSAAAAAINPIVASLGGLYRVRSLWLLSFVQDMGTFMSNTRGLDRLLNIQEALRVVKDNRDQRHAQNDEQEFTRLACLFAICVVLQGSMCHEQGSTYLESFLRDRRESWLGSVDGLHQNLCEVLDPEKNEYVLNVTSVLRAMSHEAQRGVEACLLQILHPERRDHFSMSDEITPDMLLSSLHGH